MRKRAKNDGGSTWFDAWFIGYIKFRKLVSIYDRDIYDLESGDKQKLGQKVAEFRGQRLREVDVLLRIRAGDSSSSRPGCSHTSTWPFRPLFSP